MGESPKPSKFLGTSVERSEDPVLLTGQALFTDDWPERRGTLQGAILRSPHAHAEITTIDVTNALEQPGVIAVITGKEVQELTDPFLIVLRKPMDQWCLAVDKVRFVGESVALVVADDRYKAEDALEYIEVRYKKLPAIVDPIKATQNDAPLVHPAVGSNVPSNRSFSYGEPDKAFEEADKIVKLVVDYPRNSQTPLETYVVMADWRQKEGIFDVVSNFQGPFTVHPVMSKSLRVNGTQLRMRTPAYSGGGFGVKQAIFPYVVLMCVASKIVGRPVKWVEDRLEHLSAAIAAPNRIIRGEAAVMNDGTVTGFRFDQLDDYGAFLRPPMPGPLYRQHGIMTGAYGVKNMTINNRVVMTNKTPSGMVRGFGGPQIYYAIERLMHQVSVELDMDPLDVITKNLIPAGSFPYRAAAGALIDSGNYQEALKIAKKDGRLDELKERQKMARAEGKHYGIGYAVVVEPAQSNMGYLSTINTVEERKKSGNKSGAVAYATVHVDPLGGVSVTADSLPQGQGHGTILSQIVADQLGLFPEDILANMERDTHKDPWSIATGNYSSRFSSATAVAAHKAAIKVRKKLARIAATRLNVKIADIEFGNRLIFSKENPDNNLRFTRVAGIAHWSVTELPDGMTPAISETVSHAAPQLEAPNDKDQINTSLTYGFVFDFCGVEVDADTGQVKIDRYVTMHDSGKILNPLLAEGQVYGAFAWGIGCALLEEFRYGEDGSFHSGTFADYLCPTACEVPEPQILHMESPSPFTPLGAKGIAEGNCMSTPVCIANAVADAIGVSDLRLPLTPSKLLDFLELEEPERPAQPDNVAGSSPLEGGNGLSGQGEALVKGTPEAIWETLLNPEKLAAVIPGCHELKEIGENSYTAEISLGVGMVRGRFNAEVNLSDLIAPKSAVLSGGLNGPLGSSRGMGKFSLEPVGEQTRISYSYQVDISGKVAAIGGRMLDGATRTLINQFLKRLAAQIDNEQPKEPQTIWQKFMQILGFKQ